MRNFSQRLQLVAVAGSMFVAGYFFAAGAKEYQVTGNVIKMDDKTVVVEKKDGEKWELNRSADTKVTGELKVGAKVTAQYVMDATDIEVKKDK